ncbi:hypothetical protein KTT_24540 [Tengunoibacter tsumagoiensis]|uniref:Uncharacterized protein n=1 Tax=Tengunoibacter tsumagoiensis TaxID=2014871 RepID=A0A402A0I4_9CHLR|nr:hypothetical protein KTT_24540 [Tengunoibacter tsumagoiensis]
MAEVLQALEQAVEIIVVAQEKANEARSLSHLDHIATHNTVVTPALDGGIAVLRFPQ